MGIDLRWITDQVRLESSIVISHAIFFVGGGGGGGGQKVYSVVQR